jgi:hypothetical protein
MEEPGLNDRGVEHNGGHALFFSIPATWAERLWCRNRAGFTDSLLPSSDQPRVLEAGTINTLGLRVSIKIRDEIAKRVRALGADDPVYVRDSYL